VATQPADGARAVPVVARIFTAQMIENAVILRGQTEAARNVEVRAETSGKVVSEPIARGAAVTTGQVLCRLDEGTRAATLAEAQARLAEAQLNNRNAEALQAGGFSAETRTISTRATLQGAEAALEAAQRDLARLDITAPFAGVLEDETAELGSLLQPGGLCARVIQLDPIRLVGFAPEADVGRVTLGAPAFGRLVDGREVNGTVSFVARSADTATRTFRVEVTVPNPDLSIRDGQTADIAVATKGTMAHLIPGSALTLNDTGALGLRIVDTDSRALFVPVQVLRDTADGIWVSGLPDTAQVITLGQEYVVDGVSLTVTVQETTQ
jgi:multidrug efflux system membrane fusion protein